MTHFNNRRNAERLHSKVIPIPTAGDDEKAIVWDNDTGAFKYVANTYTGGDGIDITTNAISVDLAALPGLEIDTAKLKAKVDDSTIEIDGVGGALQVKDSGITTAKLASVSGADTTVITGTAGTSGNIAQFNVDGDIVDGSSSDTDVASAVSLKHTQNTDTGTTGSTFTIDSDASTGKIVISAQADVADKTMTIQNAALTDNRVVTIQDATQTLVGRDTTDTLTNKTIDGDDNTVQDLPYTAIKSTARSGSDVTLVTGTKGTENQIAYWNADGDAIGMHTKQIIILHGGGGWASTTDGDAGFLQTELTTNDVDIKGVSFPSTAAAAYHQWHLPMPGNYDGSTVTAIFYWTTHDSSPSGDISWKVQWQAYGNDDPLDAAWGSAIEVVDTIIAQNDQHISVASGAITGGNTPVAGDNAAFRVYRDGADASDTSSNDVVLQYVVLLYGTNSPTAG